MISFAITNDELSLTRDEYFYFPDEAVWIRALVSRCKGVGGHTCVYVIMHECHALYVQGHVLQSEGRVEVT